MAKSANADAAMVRCSKRTLTGEEEEEGEVKLSWRSRTSKLADDLWVEVFLRLPNCRSAIRCGVVSKHWSSLIHNSFFISSFIHRQKFLNLSSDAEQPFTFLFQFHTVNRARKKDRLGFQIYRMYSKESEILHQGRPLSLSSQPNYLSFFPFPIMMRASFNDLLLVCGLLGTNRRTYLIGNPLTRQYVTLPTFPEWFDPDKFGLVRSTETDGDEQNRRLRVVLLCYTGCNRIRVATFCFETWKWSQSVVTTPRPLMSHFRDGLTVSTVACNGMLHWVEGDYCAKGIGAFDPFKEQHCLFIDPPGNLNPKLFTSDHICLGTCRGRLRISHLYRGRYAFGLTLRVWELRDYENCPDSWQLKHETFFQNRDMHHRVLAFQPHDPHVIFLQHISLVYQYDWRSHTTKKVFQFPTTPNEACSLHDDELFYPLVHPLWPTPVPKHPSISLS